MDCTPGSKSQISSIISSSGDQVPTTPKLPFDPPRRRSSLAFSKLIDAPQPNVGNQDIAAPVTDLPDQSPLLHPVPGRTGALYTPARHSEAIPGHVDQVQKVLQTARANLQFDMHFAASPIGSLDARLPQMSEEADGTQECNTQPEGFQTPWRYSTIPSAFLAVNMDVREPVPDTSPPLPAMDTRQHGFISPFLSLEPTSSGFASPASAGFACSSTDAISCLPGLNSHSSRDASACDEAGDLPDLTGPMTGLNVETDSHIHDESLSDCMDDSPIIEHLRRKSEGEQEYHDDLSTLPGTIFLSKSAKAAAESAIAKRESLKKAVAHIAMKEHMRPGKHFSDRSAYGNTKLSCPDPELHHHTPSTPCPDPFAHLQTQVHEEPYHNSDIDKAQPRAWGNERLAPRGNVVAHNNPLQPRRRTTAAGSPMPFVKRAFSPPCGVEDTHMPQLGWMSSPPRRVGGEPLNDRPHAPQHNTKISEHFRPGWQYPSHPIDYSNQPTVNLYSFSTAAAKATGGSAAPDLRIRDSYRTDTLTPLALPPGRFRKNGLGATLQTPNSQKHHRGPVMAPRLTTSKCSTRNTKNDAINFQGLQTRSSPPLPSVRPMLSQNTRKRGFADAGMPEFNISADSSVVSHDQHMRLRPSEEVMQISEETRAAVRMSVFGPNTPEYLHGVREGIKELSPNVNIWRKGLQLAPHYRKKRRPSYWDGDLEAVKMSPAGRGGIASSPPLSKRSMVAELEVMSDRAETITMENMEYEVESGDREIFPDKENILPIVQNDAFEMEA